MSKKWYNFFVSVDQGAQEPEQAAAPSAAQTIAEIAATIAPPPEPVAMPAQAASGSFTDIYEAAEIRPPAHGFTILKVADLLQSEHIRKLPRDVKRSSVLLALEAGGANAQQVIEDAIKRDRALDTFERLQEQQLAALESAKTKENQQIQAELDRLVAEYRGRMQANTDEVARERERFYGWRLKKQEEEQKIADAVSYFVTENPITTRPAAPGGNTARGATAAPPAPASPSPAEKAGE
jgi:hypothetical protein